MGSGDTAESKDAPTPASLWIPLNYLHTLLGASPPSCVMFPLSPLSLPLSFSLPVAHSFFFFFLPAVPRRQFVGEELSEVIVDASAIHPMWFNYQLSQPAASASDAYLRPRASGRM